MEEALSWAANPGGIIHNIKASKSIAGLVLCTSEALIGRFRATDIAKYSVGYMTPELA